MIRGGLIPLGEVARRGGVTHRCQKRRLQKLSKKLLRLHPEKQPHLLVQFCDGGDYFVDAVIAEQYVPGLLREDGVEDPMASCLRQIGEVKALVAEVHESLGLAAE